MRHKSKIALFIIVMIIMSCQKEKTIKENFIKYDLNNETVLVDEDLGLGIEISGNYQDTIWNIDDGKSIKIEFPKVDKPEKFDIYRVSDPYAPKGMYYLPVKDFSDHKAYYTFIYEGQTQFKGKKAGEINITRVDLNSREIEGTFFFNAYGYLMKDQHIYTTYDSVEIKNGSFYCHWDKWLDEVIFIE